MRPNHLEMASSRAREIVIDQILTRDLTLHLVGDMRNDRHRDRGERDGIAQVLEGLEQNQKSDERRLAGPERSKVSGTSKFWPPPAAARRAAK